jgi:hypothetical protein
MATEGHTTLLQMISAYLFMTRDPEEKGSEREPQSIRHLTKEDLDGMGTTAYYAGDRVSPTTELSSLDRTKAAYLKLKACALWGTSDRDAPPRADSKWNVSERTTAGDRSRRRGRRRDSSSSSEVGRPETDRDDRQGDDRRQPSAHRQHPINPTRRDRSPPDDWRRRDASPPNDRRSRGTETPGRRMAGQDPGEPDAEDLPRSQSSAQERRPGRARAPPTSAPAGARGDQGRRRTDCNALPE